MKHKANVAKIKRAKTSVDILNDKMDTLSSKIDALTKKVDNLHDSIAYIIMDATNGVTLDEYMKYKYPTYIREARRKKGEEKDD